jgi:hypothetical protein
MQKMNDVLTQWRSSSQKQQGRGRRALQSVAVRTFVHVVTSGSVGAINNTVINRQLALLNHAFDLHGFTFVLVGITR